MITSISKKRRGNLSNTPALGCSLISLKDTVLVNVSEDGSISIDYQAVAKFLLNTFHCISYVGTDGEGLDASSQASADLYVYDPDTGIYSRDTSALKAKITEICNGVGYQGSITTITREILHYVAYEDPRIYPFNLGEDRCQF